MALSVEIPNRSRYFIDTEFDEDGKEIRLLSIGVTDDNGRDFYAVNKDADHNRCNDWVKQNVIPHLGVSFPSPHLPDAKAHTKEQIAKGLFSFIETRFWADGKQPVFYGYYADYDWVVLCQLYGRMVDLPNLFPHLCLDLKQIAVMMGVQKSQYPKQGTIEHNALNDAKWNRDLYNHLLMLSRQP